MSEQNLTLNNLVLKLKKKESFLISKLNDISSERKRREYRDNILQLANTDLSLLATYYLNSNDEEQNQFNSLLFKVYSDKKYINIFRDEFKNLYYLNKGNYIYDEQYGQARRIVLDFVNLLKDEVKDEKKINVAVEKKYVRKLFIVKKLIKYFSFSAGEVEIKNIDDFIIMLNTLNFDDKEKNEAISIVIENNCKFYSKYISKTKNSFDEK